MISYEITSVDIAHLKSSRRLNKVIPGDANYQEAAFHRASNACKLQIGDIVKIRGTNKKGRIVARAISINEVKWNKNTPHILQVEIEGNIFSAHPSQLKRTTKL